MSFPRYPKYKDSGVEWLGEVPEHWGDGSVRWLSKRYSGGTPDKKNLDYWENGTIPWLNSGAVNDSLIKLPSTYITEDAFEKSSAKWIPEKSLVMALAGQGKTKGMVAQVDFRTTCNQSMAVIVPGPYIHPRYLLWWLDSNYQNIRNMAGGDLRDGLNLELIGNIKCPLPTDTEQIAIASFLDRETGKIDALVDEQRRLIELLKEKRQAVISHAVTKGLDPDVAMKDSGVEWLGEVPVHWKVGKLRYYATFCTGSTPSRDSPQFWNGKIPWVKTGEIRYETIVRTAEHITQDGLDSSSCSIAPAGSLLMALYGQGVTRGRVAILGIPAAFNQACVAINTDQRLNTVFLQDFFVFAYSHIREVGNENTQMNMNVEFVRRIPIAIPPIHEQEAISECLVHETNRFNSLSDEASSVITLLQERRTALISAAVTGKIDVRTVSETQTEPGAA